MLTKNKNSIYTSILIKVMISLLISISTFYLLSDRLDNYIDGINNEFLKNEQKNIEEFIEYVQNEIDNKDLTYKEAKRMKFTKGARYDIEFFIYSSINFDELNLDQKGIKYIYKIEYDDMVGLATVTLNSIKMTANLYSTVIKVISMTLFIVISVIVILKELSYIKVITKGINQISSGDFTYKIPIVGKNELSDLALKINDMARIIDEKIQKEKEDEMHQRSLITNMSHDLKTPLTSMIGYIDILQSKLEINEQLYQYTTVAKKNGYRLEKLIGDLFLYSKLISNDVSIDIKTFDIEIILNQILEIRKDNIIYNPKYQNIKVKIDFEKFHRVIDNLVTNATTYGIEGMPIVVSLDVEDDIVIISIQNYTKDKLKDKIHLLKRRLYTANEERSNGSSGLGLSIVAELLKIMDSELELGFNNQIFTATIKMNRV